MPMIFQFGTHTETAGTIITEVIPAVSGKIPSVRFLDYLTAGTGHTLTFLKTVATTSAASRAVTGQAIIEMVDAGAMKDSSGDDEVLAANDFIVYVDEDGVQRLGVVSSVSGNDVTLTANLGGVVDAGSAIYLLGELARAVHLQITTEISVATERLVEIRGGIAGQTDQHNTRSGAGDPMVFHSDNVTAAGELKFLGGVYVDPDEVTMT